jgi:hypothetical protein
MAEYKVKIIKAQKDIVAARNRLKEQGLRHGEHYVVETLHDIKGYPCGYRLYYNLDDETFVWMKLHGIIS